MVGEALELRPYSGVEDPYDDVVGVVGVGPEAEGVGEAEEARGVGGVGVADLVGVEGEDGGVAAEVGGLGWGEADGEA